MDDEKKIKFLRTTLLILEIIDLTLMVTTIVLQFVAFEPRRHIIMCNCIVVLTGIIFDIHTRLKFPKAVVMMHLLLWLVWIVNLVKSLIIF